MPGDFYSRISARFWIDTKAWGERNQLVALYLLTNPHRSMEGLYHLPVGYLCADLNLTPVQAKAALAEIETRGLVAYDGAAEVIFIRKALKHGAPCTPNHITSAIRRLKAVPSTCLWDQFLMACACHAHGLADRIEMESVSASRWQGSSSILKLNKDTNHGGAKPNSSLKDAFVAEGQSGVRTGFGGA